MALQWDPEWAKAADPILSTRDQFPVPAVHDIQAYRARVAMMFGALVGALPDAPEVEVTTHTTKSFDGAEITIYRYLKKGSTSQSAILHAHGGGMIAGTVPMLSKNTALDVQATGVQTFSVEYRLAPENSGTGLVEDCYAGLLWLHEHAKEFNVDTKRIAVAGESAGGGLAAGVALLARDRKLSPPLAKQILVYPMLDDRNTKSDPTLEPFLIWSTNDNITGWTAVFGDKIGGEDSSPYAAPARVKNVEGLPPTYIDVGTLDLFRDEDIAYAARLAAANIPLELHIYPGVPHAFEALGADSDVVRKATANRMKAKMTF